MCHTVLHLGTGLEFPCSSRPRKTFLRKEELLREIGSRVILCSLSPVVREVLRLSKLLAVFEIYEDENQALVSHNLRVEWEANGAGRGNRGGGYIGPGLDLDSCNPSVPRCLFYLVVCPFRGEPLRSGLSRLTSDGS